MCRSAYNPWHTIDTSSITAQIERNACRATMNSLSYAKREGTSTSGADQGVLRNDGPKDCARNCSAQVFLPRCGVTFGAFYQAGTNGCGFYAGSCVQPQADRVSTLGCCQFAATLRRRNARPRRARRYQRAAKSVLCNSSAEEAFGKVWLRVSSVADAVNIIKQKMSTRMVVSCSESKLWVLDSD